MARLLLGSSSVELGIIAPANVRRVTRSDYRQVKQWLVPNQVALGRDGLPPNYVTNAIVEAVNEFSPDLVHTWGTESYFGLLVARGYLRYPALLEIQGLKEPCATVFNGGLTPTEQLKCIGPKEVLKLRFVHTEQRAYRRWGRYEQEIICGHQFVDVQSPWASAHVTAINSNCKLFHTDLVLREPFYTATEWRFQKSITLFCSAAYPVPFKGIHVAIRALKALREAIPNARLRIAGAHQRHGIRQEGYIRWLNTTVSELDLVEAIDWLGPIDAYQVIEELSNAGAMVIPTYIENCCTAMQEAMAVGTPVVASYVGGIPSLGKDEESCLFFPPGDFTLCAHQLRRVLSDPNLAARLSSEARQIAVRRNDQSKIVQAQLDIYNSIVNPNLS